MISKPVVDTGVVLLCRRGFGVQLRQTRANEFNSFANISSKSVRLVPVLLFLLLLFGPAEVIQAHPPEQVTDCTTASPGPDPSATVCVSDVIVTTAGVSPNNRFSVSWISTSRETGAVKLIGGDTLSDIRGASFSGITHYVQVSNLQPNTDYQFDINSGGNTYTNNGQHWSINIGPVLTPAAPDNIIGRVKNPGGGDAAEALVYARVQRASDSAISSLLSMNPPMSSDDSGFFHSISVSDARSVDASSNYDGRFSYNSNNDKLTLTAVGPGGYGSTTANINAAHPRPGGVNVILTLGSGFVSYNTPTPTPIPPTSTPTPITPTATQTLPALTATALAATETATAFTSTPTLTPAPPSATAPRPTATTQPLIPPTATVPFITIVPAGQTQVAEATLESTQEVSPEPLITRVLHPITTTPEASSVFAGIASGGSIFAVLAATAFIGAATLGAAALYVWKR